MMIVLGQIPGLGDVVDVADSVIDALLRQLL